MKKAVKVMVVVMSLLVTFALIGCGKNNELKSYKDTAKASLDTYVAEKGQGNYITENWTVIAGLLADGKTAVDAAESKSAVDAAKAVAITAIDGVSPREEVTMQRQAKQTYLDNILRAKNPNATIDDVSFFHNKFLGIYNGSLVAVFYGGQYHGMYPEGEEKHEISGLTFRWSMGYPILVWNDGEIYELEQAFAQNLLTATNLVIIHELYYSES